MAEPIWMDRTETQSRFEDLFENSAAVTIRSMDNAKDDIASQTPKARITIPRVGFARDNIPVNISNPLSESENITVFCNVSIHTGVPCNTRGVHMSRMNNILASTSLAKYKNLQDFCCQLAREIFTSHYQRSTEVYASAVLPIYSNVKGWKEEKNKVSLDHIKILAKTVYDGATVSETAGIEVNHITACPCVQKTFAHANNLQEMHIPLLTHSQRSTTCVEISNLTGPLSLEELISAVDAVIFRVQNTLPREYELKKVFEAHSKPQFIEDVVRDVALEVSKRFKGKTENGMVHISSSSQESIHDFNITANMDYPL